MPDYDFYLVTVAQICSQKKPSTAPEIWKAMNQKIDISRDKVNYLIASADSRYGITCEEDGQKPLYALEWKEVVRSVLLTRNLLTVMQRTYRKQNGSPELRAHLKQFFTKFPDLLNRESGIQQAKVYSVCHMQKVLAVLRTFTASVSVQELARCLKKEEFSVKQVRRIAEKEIPAVFFAEISGGNSHYIRLLPESKIKIFHYFTPEDLLSLYDFLYHAGLTELF